MQTTGRDIVQCVQQLQDSLCGECEIEVAVVDCEDCHESYCKTCCEGVHKKGRRKQHTNFIKIQICGQCEVVAASKECLDCKEFYCEPCCIEVHVKGQRVRHKHIHDIDTTQFRAVNFDQSNAFSLITKELVLSRFITSDDYTDTLGKHGAFFASVAAECREEEKPFVDTTPAPLNAVEIARPQQISSQMQPDVVMEEMEQELKQAEAMRQRKLAAVADIMTNVYAWRRPKQFAQMPALFTVGNSILEARPAGREAPTGYVCYLPVLQNSIFKDSFFILACMLFCWFILFFNEMINVKRKRSSCFTFSLHHSHHTTPYTNCSVRSRLTPAPHLQPLCVLRERRRRDVLLPLLQGRRAGPPWVVPCLHRQSHSVWQAGM